MKIRDEVMELAEEIERQMRNEDDTIDWKDCNMKKLYLTLDQKIANSRGIMFSFSPLLNGNKKEKKYNKAIKEWSNAGVVLTRILQRIKMMEE
jgi:uncharacterized lipoprotein YddW (UPF0748 family)